MTQKSLLEPDNAFVTELLSLVSTAEKPETTYYYFEFSKKLTSLREQEVQKDSPEYKTAELFSKITSFYMNLDDVNVYRPMIMMSDSRSALPEDLDEDEKKFLFDILAIISDPELKARISDVLWIIKYPEGQAFRNAGIAIKAYIESAQKLLEYSWHPSHERLERAFQLSSSLGKQYKDDYDTVHALVEKIIDQNNCEEGETPSSPFIKLLLKYSKSDLNKYAAATQATALKYEAEYHFDSAKEFWNLNGKIHTRSRNKEGAEQAYRNAANQDIVKAQRLLQSDSPQYLLAASFLEEGIQGLRQHGEDKAKIDELHKLLLECQAQLYKSTMPIEHSVDVTDEIVQRVSLVTGKSTRDAILTLARMCYLPTKDKIQKQAFELSKASVYRRLAPIRYFNSKGKTVGTSESTLSYADAAEVSEQEVNAQLVWNCVFEANLQASAIQQVSLEHNLRKQDLDFIVYNNGFVPKGRETVFSHGLIAGFNGDFLSASHILIPQLENSFRYLLEQRGEVTSSLDSSGIQKEKSLEETLKHPAILDIFGEDLIFLIKGILSEGGNGGLNLRNELSHGLISSPNYELDPKFVYVWSLTLWLCSIPLIIRLSEMDTDDDSSENEDAPESEHDSGSTPPQD